MRSFLVAVFGLAVACAAYVVSYNLLSAVLSGIKPSTDWMVYYFPIILVILGIFFLLRRKPD